jgi:hypothetical protein
MLVTIAYAGNAHGNGPFHCLVSGHKQTCDLLAAAHAVVPQGAVCTLGRRGAEIFFRHCMSENASFTEFDAYIDLFRSWAHSGGNVVTFVPQMLFQGVLESIRDSLSQEASESFA